MVQFAFRQPDAIVTIDARVRKPARIDLGETTLRADVVLAMDADTGRALLTGELSPTLALARGDVHQGAGRQGAAHRAGDGGCP